MEMNTETIVTGLLLISELLAMTSLKSNSIFQLVVNILKRLGANTSGGVAVPAATFPPPETGK